MRTLFLHICGLLPGRFISINALKSFKKTEDDSMEFCWIYSYNSLISHTILPKLTFYPLARACVFVCVCERAAATEESTAVWWTLGVKPRGRRLLRTKGQSCCQVNDLWPLTKTLTSVILFNTQQSTQCLLSLCFPLLCDHQQFPPKP